MTYWLSASFIEKSADNLSCRTVHQVPVVDVTRIREIEIEDLPFRARIAALELPGENHQGKRAVFVNRGLQQSRNLSKTDCLVSPREFSQCRHPYAAKAVSFTVFAAPCLEVALEKNAVARI